LAAAVTIDSGYPKVNVNGSSRELYYIFDIAADADYLDVPFRDVENVTFVNDTDTTDVAVASIAVSGYGARITLDTPGAVTNVYCRVTGK
jgi:hypothetical protein